MHTLFELLKHLPVRCKFINYFIKCVIWGDKMGENVYLLLFLNNINCICINYCKNVFFNEYPI